VNRWDSIRSLRGIDDGIHVVHGPWFSIALEDLSVPAMFHSLRYGVRHRADDAHTVRKQQIQSLVVFQSVIRCRDEISHEFFSLDPVLSKRTSIAAGRRNGRTARHAGEET
jgi:hypothetical protein